MNRILLALLFGALGCVGTAQAGTVSQYDQLLKTLQQETTFNAADGRLEFTTPSDLNLQPHSTTLDGLSGGVTIDCAQISDAAAWCNESASAARTSLGITATGSDTTYAYRSNNLSDLANESTARTNLGAAASGANSDITSLSDMFGATFHQISEPSNPPVGYLSVWADSGLGTTLYALDASGHLYVMARPISATTHNFISALSSNGNFTQAQPSFSDLSDYVPSTSCAISIAAATTNPTVTYSAQVCDYTQAGKQLTLTFHDTLSAYSGGSGNLRLSGLPCTIGGSSGENFVGNVILSNVTFGSGYSSVNLNGAQGNGYLFLTASGSGVATTSLSVGALSSSSDIKGTITAFCQ